MASLQPFMIDGDDLPTLDDSTAPTTPDGSSSFSPELRPQADLGFLNPGPLAVTARPRDAAAAAPPPVRNICFIGAGFVGGPTAAVIALHNPDVRVSVVDRDEKRIRRWNSKHPPIYEPGLNKILRVTRDGSRESLCDFKPPAGWETRLSPSSKTRNPNLVFSSDVARSVAQADIVMVAVNTPTKRRGNGGGSATDMAAFEAVTATVAEHARPGAIIVEKSTVPCRTSQLLAIHRPGVHFEILSNPEFLSAGTAINDLLYANRILIGARNTESGRRAASALASVYASWIPPERIITTNCFSSELAKLVANAMLAQRISSMNSIAAICEKTGADVDEVAGAIGADPRIGSKFLRAGIGFGGSCFKKDILSLVYLAETLVLPEVAQYWRAVVDMNEFARNRFVTRAVKCLNNTLTGKKVTVLGFAFKKNTNDTRESPALDIIRALEEEGPAEIAVYDPLCPPTQMSEEIGRFAGNGALQSNGGSVVVYSDVYAACRGTNAVLITTEFDEFKNRAGRSGDQSRPLESTQTPSMRLAHAEDPLCPIPPCSDDCPDCQVEASSTLSFTSNPEQRRTTKMDWTKVYYHMRRPQWVLDGRGVLEIESMERIGFRVESVGRCGANQEV
ncbi:hypothetical protein C8A05DRAFT_46098 [Staphylotrichum tortipilum]|uniref:UDP-glucose 6-dehydrogenase n=1 Tax=Staphylotrichum tortipilum TaxID=2831512 RepID=A0AAN6RRM8_9PEZI|nr:hypothetical protein C8A05DRAFT_46098 [Staphylotrichum longicolle]